MYKRIKQVLAVFMIFSLIVSYVNLHVLAKEDAEIILHQGETYKIPMSDMLISQKEKSDKAQDASFYRLILFAGSCMCGN